jgi:hypothetical protein
LVIVFKRDLDLFGSAILYHDHLPAAADSRHADLTLLESFHTLPPMGNQKKTTA